MKKICGIDIDREIETLPSRISKLHKRQRKLKTSLLLKEKTDFSEILVDILGLIFKINKLDEEFICVHKIDSCADNNIDESAKKILSEKIHKLQRLHDKESKKQLKFLACKYSILYKFSSSNQLKVNLLGLSKEKERLEKLLLEKKKEYYLKFSKLNVELDYMIPFITKYIQ